MTRPLLLLHPLGSDGRCWEEVVAHLDGVETIVMDLPGHGRTPCLPPGSGITDFARTVADALAGERVHVAGMSLGGLVAQELAARHPTLVDHLILADAVAVYPEAMRQMWRDRAQTARERGLAELAEPMAVMWFTASFRSDGNRTPERIRELFLSNDPEGYARACEALEHADTTPLIPQITARSLVLCGSADLTPFTAAASWLYEHLGASELAWMKEAKHAAVLERPAEFAAALRAFLPE